MTEPVLGPWAHLSLPLGTQAGRRDGPGWTMAKDAMLVPAMMSGQYSSKDVTFCTEGEYKMDVKTDFPSWNTSLPCPAHSTLLPCSGPA